MFALRKIAMLRGRTNLLIDNDEYLIDRIL